MSKQIHDIAQSILSDLKTAGLNVGGGFQFWPFPDAKVAAANAVIHGRRLLADVNSKEVTAAFDELLCLAPPRSWAQLGKFLNELEGGLERLIDQHKPAEPEQGKAPEWVYFVVKKAAHPKVCRYNSSSDKDSFCEHYLGGNRWGTIITTKQVAMELIEGGHATTCQEPGIERVEVEMADPETGFTYRVTKDGEILSRPPNGSSFYAAPCTINVIKTLARLGLLEI